MIKKIQNQTLNPNDINNLKDNLEENLNIMNKK